MSMTKDSSINVLLSKLSLPDRGWQIVDHWEADLFAVDIGSERTEGKLVYISTYDKKPGKYDFECEISKGADYETVKSGKDVDFTVIESVLADWLHD